MTPRFHLQPPDPIVHAVDKGVFTKDKLNQVAPWVKPLLTCGTLNKTHLLTVAPKILCDLSLPNLSDCSFNHPLPHSLESMTSLTFPTHQACSSPKAFTWAAPSALNNLAQLEHYLLREDLPDHPKPLLHKRHYHLQASRLFIFFHYLFPYYSLSSMRA